MSPTVKRFFTTPHLRSVETPLNTEKDFRYEEGKRWPVPDTGRDVDGRVSQGQRKGSEEGVQDRL